MNIVHHAFPSIDQFSHVRRNVQNRAQYRGKDENNEVIMDRTAQMPTLSYEGTVKLHGTNAAIVLEKDGFYCQSRERIISQTSDNAGFANWASSLTEDALAYIKSNFPSHPWGKVAIYGEWAGQSIQKGVAISTLPKAFYIFGARLITENPQDEIWLDIKNWTLPEGVYNIYNYPTFKIDINFESSEYAVAEINKWVLEVEAECPVGKAHSISGIGEGIVFRCVTAGWESCAFWFKAKGALHSATHVKKLATVDIEKYESEQAFIAAVLDEGRLEQGFNWLKENNKPQDQTGIGEFIRWIFGDVLKECLPEMEESGIQEKNLGKLLANPAKKWYFARLNK